MRKLLGLLLLCLTASVQASAQQLRVEWLNDSYLKIPIRREGRASTRQ